MHTLRLKLKATEADKYNIECRFRAISHVHNILVRECIRRLNRLKQDLNYRAAKDEYAQIMQKKDRGIDDESKLKILGSVLNECIQKYGLTAESLESYIKLAQKKYRKLIASQQVQKECRRVFNGVEKVLYGGGKQIHFKKGRSFSTISGKSNSNGVKFDRETFSIEWAGLKIECDISRDIDYIRESLGNNKVKYCELKRLMFPNGWHYYVIIYLDDDAPRKCIESKESCMGIDPGMSTVAGFSDTRCVFEELAPRAKEYDRRINSIQQKMDHKKRLLNPDRYNKDGTIIKNIKKPWSFSKGYLKLRDRLKYEYERKTAYVKQCHEELADRLIADSLDFIIEKMNYSALARRSKKTERQEKETEVKASDGTAKTVCKYKKKKRYGRSVNDRSPVLFLTILEKKCISYGGTFNYVNTASFKASQYDHTSGECTKIPLSQRRKLVSGHEVLRDLYSAFLIRNTDDDYLSPDRDRCIDSYDIFLQHQGDEIIRMTREGADISPCFGLKKLRHVRTEH